MDIDRIQGVLYGLAAGDRNGGPTAMALQMSASLVEQHAFDADDILQRYVKWWLEEGFDTGPIAAQVFRLVSGGMSYQEATYEVHLRNERQTAGCNPAHRVAPLAMAAFQTNEQLSDAAHREAALTHFDPLAGDVAAIVVRLCRLLIHGTDWFQALDQVLPKNSSTFSRFPERKQLNASGFAPDVLTAAIYFLNHYPRLKQRWWRQYNSLD